MTHKMHASVYFLLELIGFLTCLLFNFQILIFVCLFIFRKFIAFPWLSMAHTSISGIPGLENKITKFHDLASFSYDPYKPCVCGMWLEQVDSMNLF